MTTATDFARDFFMRLALSDDGLGYPDPVAVVATDHGNVVGVVQRNLDEGTPIVVIDAHGAETLLVPTSRFNRVVGGVQCRGRVRVELRRPGVAAVCSSAFRDWAALERELAL